MNNELALKVRAAMVTEFRQAVEEAWSQISTALDQAAINASMAGKDSLKFPVAAKVILEPCGDECAVSISVSFGTRAKLSIEPVRVSNQPELGVG